MRLWGVIILVLGISVIAILPLADEYDSVCKQRDESRALVAQTRAEAANLEEARQVAFQCRKDLSELKALTVPEEEVPAFRQEVVEWAREAGCQVRRIRVEGPRTRRWEAPGEKSQPARQGSPQDLSQLIERPLSITVSGALPNVEALLDRLYASRRMIQFAGLTLNPTRDNRKEVVLDLNLTLLELKVAQATSP
jgi:Tfp pilus assembly protein PilO